MNYRIFLVIFLVGTSGAISQAMDHEEYATMLREKKKLDTESPSVQGPIYYPKSNEANAGECSICLEPINSMEIPSCMMRCNHVFHFDCIKEWTGKNSTCPLCRTSDEVSVQAVERRMVRINHSAPIVSTILSGIGLQIIGTLCMPTGQHRIIGSED